MIAYGVYALITSPPRCNETLLKPTHGSSSRLSLPLKEEHGVALIMTLLVIALASALTVYIGSTTYFNARLHESFVQRTQAEFILKSALNVARVLIAQGSGSADPPPDSWGPLTQGIQTDASVIGIDTPNVVLGLEVTGIESKISLTRLQYKPGQTDASERLFVLWRDVLTRLFENLGFDADNEKDLEGPFKDQFFDSKALVANIIDYMDADYQSYQDSEFQGIEGNLKKGTFPNKPIKRIVELNSVPGFTPARIRKLTPYVTAEESLSININLANTTILKALDPSIDDEAAQTIIEYARGEEGPFDSTKIKQVLPSLMPDYDNLANILSTRSLVLQVIAKVQYGTSKYFLRAFLEKPSRPGGSNKELPEIKRMEFFG